MRPDILAIDFGTSNSAAAILENGVPRRLPIQPGSDTLPTAVFFPTEGGAMRIGDARRRRADRAGARAIHASAEERAGRAAPARAPNDRRYTADARGRDRRLPPRTARARRGGDGGAVPAGALRPAGAFPHRRSGARRPSGGRSQGLLSRRGVRGGGVPLRARGRGARVSGAGDRRRRRAGRRHRRRHLGFHRLRRRETARCGCSRATASGSAARTSTRRSRWRMRCRSSASAASCAARWGRASCRCRRRSTPTWRPGRRYPSSTPPRRAGRRR